MLELDLIYYLYWYNYLMNHLI